MNGDLVIQLTRQMLELALLVSAPILLVGMAVGLIVSVGQVVTSVQDVTLATVPRLAAVGAAAFLLSPWIFREMVTYTARLLGDFHPFLR